MSTIISVNTMQSAYVYVGPAYQYKTITDAFVAQQYQIVIPDSYTMEATVVFNQNIIYSITVLDELIINNLNINTDDTPLYLILDGPGVITFTNTNVMNYLNQSSGFSMYINSTRINSTVDYSLNATFIQASNTRFASTFMTSFNSVDSNTSGVLYLNGCQFAGSLNLLNIISADSYVAYVSDCLFLGQLIIKSNNTDPSNTPTYTGVINIASSTITELYLSPFGLNTISPSLNISGSLIAGIASSTCTLFGSSITNCNISLEANYFPDMYVCNIQGCVIEDEAIITNIGQSNIISCIFDSGATISNMISSTLGSCGIPSVITINSIYQSIIYSCLIDTLSIVTGTSTNIVNNAITTLLTCNTLNKCDISSNGTVPSINIISATECNIRDHVDTSISCTTLNSSNISNNINISLSLGTCNNIIISGNNIGTNSNMSSGSGLVFTNNLSFNSIFFNTGNLINLNISNNNMINFTLGSITNGVISCNLLSTLISGTSTNVTLLGNVNV